MVWLLQENAFASRITTNIEFCKQPIEFSMAMLENSEKRASHGFTVNIQIYSKSL